MVVPVATRAAPVSRDSGAHRRRRGRTIARNPGTWGGQISGGCPCRRERGQTRPAPDRLPILELFAARAEFTGEPILPPAQVDWLLLWVSTSCQVLRLNGRGRACGVAKRRTFRAGGAGGEYSLIRRCELRCLGEFWLEFVACPHGDGSFNL